MTHQAFSSTILVPNLNYSVVCMELHNNHLFLSSGSGSKLIVYQLDKPLSNFNLINEIELSGIKKPLLLFSIISLSFQFESTLDTRILSNSNSLFNSRKDVLIVLSDSIIHVFTLAINNNNVDTKLLQKIDSSKYTISYSIFENKTFNTFNTIYLIALIKTSSIPIVKVYKFSPALLDKELTAQFVYMRDFNLNNNNYTNIKFVSNNNNNPDLPLVAIAIPTLGVVDAKYTLYNVNDGTIIAELFSPLSINNDSTRSKIVPSVINIPYRTADNIDSNTNNEILLTADYSVSGSGGVYIDGHDGNPTRKNGLTFIPNEKSSKGKIVISIGCCWPYVIVLVKEGLEVYDVNSNVHNQFIPFKEGQILLCKNDCFFVANNNSLLACTLIPFLTQLSSLIDNKQYKEALSVATNCRDGSLDKVKEKLLDEIHLRYGYDLFNSGQYADAMKELNQSRCDSRQILTLVPQILPEKARGFSSDVIKHPVPTKTIPPHKIKTAITAAIPFILSKRKQLLIPNIGFDNDNIKTSYAPDFVPHHSDISTLLSFYDTVLLRAYVLTEDPVLMAFLKERNFCDFDECSIILRKNNKYRELIALYKFRGMTSFALDELRQLDQSNKQIPEFDPLSEAAEIMKELVQEKENADIVFKYSSEWILKKAPTLGLNIFSSLHENPSYNIDTGIPPALILDHFRLTEISPDIRISYLESLIFKGKVLVSIFHNELIFCYLNVILNLSKSNSSHDNKLLLTSYHSKLTNFVNFSSSYSFDKVIKKFPTDSFFEERAIIYSKMGDHESALNIFIKQLKSLKLGEEYCHKISTQTGTVSVWLSFILVLLSCYNSSEGVDISIDGIIQLLLRYHAEMPSSEIIGLLSPDLPLSKLSIFFQTIISQKSELRRKKQITKNLLRAENLNTLINYYSARSAHVFIETHTLCPKCHKRIGNSAIARFPNGVVVHYSCMVDKKVS